MRIENTNVSIYAKAYLKRKYIDFVKTRPLLNSEYNILKFKHGYNIYFTKEDINKYMSLIKTCNLTYGLLLKAFVSEYPIFNGLLYLIDEYSMYKTIHTDSDEIVLSVVYIPDAKKLINETSRDKKQKEKYEKKEDNYRVINSVMNPILLDIMDKYKLMRKGDDFYFNTNQDAIDFVRTALENTIVKELAENGIKIKLNKKYQKFSANKSLFSLKNAILDLDGIKDD